MRESLQLLKKRMNHHTELPASTHNSHNFPPSTIHRPSPSERYQDLLSSQYSSVGGGTLHHARRFQEDRASLPTYQNPQYRRCFRVRVDDYEAEREKEEQMARGGQLRLPPIGRGGPAAPSIGQGPVKMRYQLYQIPAPMPLHSSPMNYSSKVRDQLTLLHKRIREKQVLSTQRVERSSRYRNNNEFEESGASLPADDVAQVPPGFSARRNFYSAHRSSIPRTINTNGATADQRYQKEQILKRINGGLKNGTQQLHLHPPQPHTSMESRLQDVLQSDEDEAR